MSTATPPRLMTAEDLLAPPDDGMERWIVRGELRERPRTVRNRWHSIVMANLAGLLFVWAQSRPQPRSKILVGEAGLILPGSPETVLGMDVMVISPELANQNPAETRLVQGVPTLAGEILSPSDTQETIHEKIDHLLNARVPLVWILDYFDHTVVEYQPEKKPRMFNSDEEIDADPILPGLRVKVAEIFQ